MKTMEQEAADRWPINNDTSEQDKSTLRMFQKIFTHGAKWQLESTIIDPKDKDMTIERFAQWLREELFLLHDPAEVIDLYKKTRIPQLNKPNERP